MSGRPGSHTGLLDRKHASGCDGKEFSTCRPVEFRNGVAIVYVTWCGECGAADWDFIDTLGVEVP